MEQALSFLAAAQNHDGGWGYQAGGASFTEPTALGLIAVAGSDAAAAAAKATDWLLAGQHDDGGWGALHADPESAWHTTVAVWGLSAARKAKASGEVAIAVSRGADWLLANRSRSLPLPNPATKLIGRLAGWSWTPGTFGWVIPTGLGLMALGAASPGGVPDSASDAVSLLVDRRCSKGGWNWGNPVLFGTELPPYATETAIAVLGLLAAGREASDDSVKSGLDWLMSNLDPNTGVTATAWAILALRAGGRDASSAIARLRGMQASDGGWRASPHATALAYLALRSGPVL